MRPRFRSRPKTPDYWITYVELGDVEIDDVKVYYDSSPPEPDVNWAGGLDIESVMQGDVDIFGLLTANEVDNLEMRLTEYLNAYGEDCE